MKLPNKAVLLVESHHFVAADPSYLSRFALWVACAEELSPYPFAHAGCMTLWCPLDDVVPPRPGDVERARAASLLVSRVLYSGQNVLVTCQAGLNRSSLVAGLALRQLGLKGRAVVDSIRQERGHNALCNTAFEKLVIKG